MAARYRMRRKRSSNPVHSLNAGERHEGERESWFTPRTAIRSYGSQVQPSTGLVFSKDLPLRIRGFDGTARGYWRDGARRPPEVSHMTSRYFVFGLFTTLGVVAWSG